MYTAHPTGICLLASCNYRTVSASFLGTSTVTQRHGVNFNSPSEAWGYKEAYRRGEEVENWQVDNGHVLLKDYDDPRTFFSRRWLSSTTPDLVFAANDLSRIASRTVLGQLGGNDQTPIKISVDLH